MAQDRVRQLVAFQMDRIEARNQRLQRHRQQEQEYFMLLQSSNDNLMKYDENQNYGRISGRVTPSGLRSPLGDSRYLSPIGSRDNLHGPSYHVGYEELHGSLPNMDYQVEAPGGMYEMLHSSMPGGLQALHRSQEHSGRSQESSGEETHELAETHTNIEGNRRSNTSNKLQESESKLRQSSERSKEKFPRKLQENHVEYNDSSGSREAPDKSGDDPEELDSPREGEPDDDLTPTPPKIDQSGTRKSVKQDPPSPPLGNFRRNRGIRRSKSFGDKIDQPRVRNQQAHEATIQVLGNFRRNRGIRRSRSFGDRINQAKERSTDEQNMTSPPLGNFHRSHGIRRSKSFNDKIENDNRKPRKNSETGETPRIPVGNFVRNHGIRRSRSFSDKINDERAVDSSALPPGLFIRNQGVRRSRSFTGSRQRFFPDTPTDQRQAYQHQNGYYSLTPSMMEESAMLDTRNEMYSPPPMDYRPFSPSTMSVPLSSWSSMSSMSGIWHSSKIEEEVNTEGTKTTILSKQKQFNDNCCMRCFSRFIFIINTKYRCFECKHYVCKNCSEYDRTLQQNVCHVCRKQGELQNQTLGWFYDNVKDKFKRFGSAKVVRSLYKRRTDSDSETEVHYEPHGYSTDPISMGRKSRPSLRGLFETDKDKASEDLPDGEAVVEDVVAAENRSFNAPYSCSVATGRETFEHYKQAELATYNSQLKLVIRDISRTLDRHSPTPGHSHRQERDLLKDQQFQLTSVLSNLSQSLHIAVDNQDPSESPASPVARHQLVKDILVKEVSSFTSSPVTLSQITKDGPQSYEEELSNIILNKVVDNYHQRVLQKAKQEEADVRRSFTKLSNQATIEQIQDNYISEYDTDITSSQVDEFTSDGEARLSDVNDLSLVQVDIGGQEVLGVSSSDDRDRDRSASSDCVEVLTNSNGQSFPSSRNIGASLNRGEDLIDSNGQSFRSPRDSDSGIVSSPTTEHPKTSLHDTSEESDDQVPRQSEVLLEINEVYIDSLKVTSPEPTVEKLQTVSDNYYSSSARDPALLNGNAVNSRDRFGSSGDVSMSDSSENRDTPTNNMRENHITDNMSDNMIGNDQQWDVVTSRTSRIRPRTGLDRNQNLVRSQVPSVADQEIDDIVTSNMINEKWSVVESKPSRVISDDEINSPRYSATSEDATLVDQSSVQSPDSSFHNHDNVFNSTPQDTQSQLQELKQQMSPTRAIPISRQIHHEDVEVQNDSDVTLGEENSSPEGSPVVEPRLHKNLIVRETLDPFDDEEEKFFEPEQDRSHVPLPSFLGSGRLAFESGDLDDISGFHGNEEEEEEDTVSTFSTEISFGRTWNFSGTENLFKDRGRISAYDNFGEKKVGRDVEGPVIMLVPNQGDESSNIKVGDRELDDLSDLSENESRSDLSTLDSDSAGEEDNDTSEVKAAMRHVLRHDVRETTPVRSPSPLHGAQNHVESAAMETTSSSDRSSIQSSTKPTISLDSLLALELISIESENGDPKFAIAPADVTVVEGEIARFRCTVAGTDPIDVFWHKEGMELVHLNDDESCESRSEGMSYYLDMYNTTVATQAQILCIAVNDQGRCVQGARLIVQKNPGEKKAPEFLKSLHDIEVKVGSRVKFRVKLSGYPTPKVNWYKDGKRLTNSFHHRIEKQGNRDYQLCLDLTSLDDDAEYTVIARNIAGEARSSAQLVIDEDGSDYEVSSVSSSRMSLPLSPPPSLPPSLPSTVPDELQGLYPDTDELLKLAEKVSQHRGDVTNTASKMLRSAGQMSTLHQQIDEMNDKLNNIEDDVKSNDQVAMETEVYKELYHDELMREHDEMHTSAYALRNVTSTALDILQSAEDIIQASKDPQGIKRKSESRSSESSDDQLEPDVELKLTFIQFEKLFTAGKITKDQMNSGKVPKSVYDDCMDYLRSENKFEQDSSHELIGDDLPTSIDCGLKRVDSKRYKRDYVINKEQPKSLPRKWEVKLSPGLQKSPPAMLEVVKSTPAGVREDAHEKINEAQEQMDENEDDSQSESEPQFYEQDADGRLARYPDLPPIAEINQVEDEIYLAAGRVTHLQEKIENLEDKVKDDDSDSMADLEDQVARAAAQVKTNERQVSLVEEHVRNLKTQTDEAAGDDHPEVSWRRMLSPVRDRPPSVSTDYEYASRTPDNQSDQWQISMERSKVTAEVNIKPVESPFFRGMSPVRSPSPVKSSPPPWKQQSVKTPPPVNSPPPIKTAPPSWKQSAVTTPTTVSSPPPIKTAPPSWKQSAVTTPPAVSSPPPIRTAPPSWKPAVTTPPAVKAPPPVVTSPPKPKPESIDLHGDSTEDVLPESRTEFEESIGLPSVRNLMSKFNQSAPEDTKKGGANVKRVYSLTGRDLPKTIREKLKEQNPIKVSNQNIRKTEAGHRQPLSSVFEDHRSDTQVKVAPEVKVTPRSSTPVDAASPKSRSSVSSDSSSPAHVQSSVSMNLSSMSNVSNGSVSSPTRVTQVARQPDASYSRNVSSPVSQGVQKQPLQRQTSSTIMARAAFWDTRITQEVASDAQAEVEKFPEMPVENFKSMED